MKFKILYFILCYFSFFAFAKVSFAAVPIQSKSLKTEIAQDSILLNESDFLMRQDSTEKEVHRLLRRARTLSNSAFASILFFFAAFWLDDIGLYEISLFLGASSILVGLILGLVALGKLIKIKHHINLFPEIAQSEYFKENWVKSLVRTILVSSIFTGSLLLLATIITFDNIESNLDQRFVIASFGGALLLLLDKIAFKTRK
jgi:hypothetical protein